jgi:hypothetical protein
MDTDGAGGALPITSVGNGAIAGGAPGISGASEESCVTPGGVPIATVGGCNPLFPEQPTRKSDATVVSQPA